jgi:hypothetical protein
MIPMNKALSKEELQALEAKLPTTMTRAEKLERWASLIEKHNYLLYIFHRLEFKSLRDRDAQEQPGSAFAVAYNDPVLKDAGLAGQTVGDAKRFFEIDDQQLHAFSCDCSGQLTPGDMAHRIRQLKHADTRGIAASLMMAFTLSGLASIATIGLLHI